ncbi:DUF4251 domain-containing protein [Mangrovibacterium lignilyticum]|uniref:DUF4251 domain-containing protein n=1 Tax=Mangrovibacterium lignilyticum TaxID=2668052 RepID=UPI0013D4ED15|nr:DUF4251 domain-containing protein [Mangrovibacterium lignilyticum]
MKTYGVLFLVLMLSLSSVCAQAFSGNGKNGKSEEIKSLVESGELLFTAEYAFKRSGQKVPLPYGYDLRIDHSFIASWLPSLERSFGESVERFQFREYARSANVVYDERNRVYQLSFDVETDSDNLLVQIRIGEDGRATLTMISNNREAVSYEGVVETSPVRNRSI